MIPVANAIDQWMWNMNVFDFHGSLLSVEVSTWNRDVYVSIDINTSNFFEHGGILFLCTNKVVTQNFR